MKLFVWDFHGVLEKGADEAVVDVTNVVLQMQGYDRQMTLADQDLLAGRRWHEYFSYLLPEACEEECFRLQALSVDISHKQPELSFAKVYLNDYADIVLNEIHHSGHRQILISNTLPESLTTFVEHVKIEKYFQPEHRFGACSHTHMNLTKKVCLQQFMQNNGPFEAIVSIGDSPSDMSLISDQSNGVSYLYTHPWKTHREAACDFKINDLRQVLSELTSKNYSLACPVARESSQAF